MPAVFHIKEVDNSFEGAVQYVVDAQPGDDVVWHCEKVDASFEGAIFHVKKAPAGYDGPVWRIVSVSPSGEVVVVGPDGSPLSLPDAIANSLSYVKAYGGTKQGLPGGYTPLEYIEMTGAQYLDTGITGYANTNVLKTKINASQVSTSCFITFQNPTSSADNLGLFLSSFRWTFQYGSSPRVSSLASANTDVSIEATNGVLKINGVSVTGTAASEFSISEPVLIGTAINGTTVEGRKFQGKIYYFRWEDSNGNVLFDGVPAKDSNNVAGMYDTVSGRFLTNQGTGDITAGPAITPTPDAPMDIVSNNGVLVFRDTELPTAYRRILGMTMNDDCYYEITGFKMNGSDTLRFSFTRTGANACNVLGAYDGNSAQSNYSLYAGGSSSTSYLRYNGGTYNSYAIADKKYDVVITPTGSDGMETDSTWTAKTFTSTTNLCIGTTSLSATSLKMVGSIHGSVVVDSRLELIPCERISDGEIGYYDTYTETFFEPIGTTPTSLGYDYTKYDIVAAGPVETIEDTIGNTATAEMLLKVGDYQDEQEILSGAITRNVGVKVLDGTEIFSTVNNTFRYVLTGLPMNNKVICNYFDGNVAPSISTSNQPDLTIKGNFSNNNTVYFKYAAKTTVEDFQQWLASQYAAGTPVIIVYPLATETTESVAGQTLQVTSGDNTLEITQASLSGLELEAEYTKVS